MIAEPAPSSEPGEFTRMFQSPVAPPPEPVVPPPAVATQVAPALPAAAPPAATPSSDPGEFTRLFQNPVTPPPEPVVPPAAVATKVTPAPLPAASAAPPAAGPGEFTRIFQSPAAPPSPGPQPGAPAAGPGEFTRLFQAPPPQTVTPAAPEPPRTPPPPATGPGEFTRMFNSPMPDAPVQGDWPPAAAKPQEPGEFTRISAPPPARAASLPQKPTGGEGHSFSDRRLGRCRRTAVFGVPISANGAGANSAHNPGRNWANTRACSVRDRRWARPASPRGNRAHHPARTGKVAELPGIPSLTRGHTRPLSAGSSEYTRLISVPTNLGAPTPGSPPAPPAGQMPGCRNWACQVHRCRHHPRSRRCRP
jgi:hypothetical protein